MTHQQMDNYQGNVPQSENPRPSGGVWLIWMFLGIVPIPIGLLIGPINIFNSGQGPNKSLFLHYGIMTAVLSLVSGIGLCGGFRRREMGRIIVGMVGGIILGFAITGINLFAVFFVGCASAFSHI